MNTQIRVFIADDHTVVREGLAHIVAAQPDMEVVGDAGNGRDAVAQIRQLRPDVVIMDISMPELNGIDATLQITQTVPESRVIILSMLGTSEHLYRSLQAGAQGYLLKDAAGRMLVEAVRAVHAGNRFFSDEMTRMLVEDYVQQRETGPQISPLDRLSGREREILQLVVEGRSSAEIAEVLSLSPKTIETYRSRLMSKLGIKDMPSLIKFALQHGLTPLN